MADGLFVSGREIMTMDRLVCQIPVYRTSRQRPVDVTCVLCGVRIIDEVAGDADTGHLRSCNFNALMRKIGSLRKRLEKRRKADD